MNIKVIRKIRGNSQPQKSKLSSLTSVFLPLIFSIHFSEKSAEIILVEDKHAQS